MGVFYPMLHHLKTAVTLKLTSYMQHITRITQGKVYLNTHHMKFASFKFRSIT